MLELREDVFWDLKSCPLYRGLLYFVLVRESPLWEVPRIICWQVSLYICTKIQSTSV